MIRLQAVSKSYTHYHSSLDRLREIISKRPHHQTFHALHPLDLDVPEGQVVGLIGNNGAGKSTLLKLITGTLHPSSGSREVRGRIGALLELGSGFHPEMTGRENVYLSGTMMGLSLDEVSALYPSIVEFSGVEAFMEQPVKNYSSGMFMRLAFAVATCVEPEILIIDEALSVGDGAFSRKSFDRIMQFKDKGRTILFCSHSLYQVEAICDRVLWLDAGRVRMDGEPARVITAYNQCLDQQALNQTAPAQDADEATPIATATGGTAKLSRVAISADDAAPSQTVALRSRHSALHIRVRFVSEPGLPAPSVGVVINGADGRPVCSAGSRNDGVELQRDAQGAGEITLSFAPLLLLKGEYWLNVYLLCENGVHLYDQALDAARLTVSQEDLEMGLVSLPRQWQQNNQENP